MEKAEVTFAGVSPADAGRLAEDFANFIQTNMEGTKAEVSGGSPDTMDLGATVVLLLGTPTIIILARGIADWIRRQGDPELVIKTKKGSVTVKSGLDLDTKKAIILKAFEKGSL